METKGFLMNSATESTLAFVYKRSFIDDSVNCKTGPLPRATDRLCARCLIAADPSSALFFLPGYFNQITACFLQRPVCVQVVV